MIPEWLAKERTWLDMTMYIAHPTRLKERGGEMEEFVHRLGFAPVNPFGCGKYEYFEGGIMGRPRTLDFGLAVQQMICGHTGVLGISDGVMGEVKDRLKWDKEKRIRVFHDAGFDPRWDEEYERLSLKYGDLFSELRGNNHLIVLVGPSAVGKTYWIERLKQYYGKNLERVKNATTRQPRDGNDKKYYYIVGKELFIQRALDKVFLETDHYLDDYYGSSLDEIKRVLRFHSGIFAMTPSGAAELYKCRFEINAHFILLAPAGDSVLRVNLGRRGISDEVRQAVYMGKAKDFTLQQNIPYQVFPITGTEHDKEKIFSIIETILKK